MESSSCIKEAITMVTNIIMAGAAIAILATLYLQKRATQASMFSDIAGRISSLLGETPEASVKDTVQHNWIVRLLNELEALVFLGKGKLLSKKMRKYYHDFIIGWIDDLPKLYPKVKELLIKNQAGAYQELREYYKSSEKKDATLFAEK